MVKMTRREFLRTVAVGTGTLVFVCTRLEVHAAGPEVYTLRIIHTNDHHARIEPVVGGTPPAPIHGGVARRKTLIDAIRAEGGNQLLIDAGDVFQGTLWFNQYLGQADLEFYNAMGYEAVTIGNHEFDAGPQPLAEFIKRAKFPVLSANVVADAATPISGLFKPWIIKEIGGEKIGIFGLTPIDTGELSSPGPGITFTPYADAARRAVAELQAQGVNKIIGLTHIGITNDRDLARAVDGIAVIIGGHSHTPMGPQVNPLDPNRPYPEVLPSPSGKTVVMATDWEWGRWLGDLTVGFDAAGNITSVVAARVKEVLPTIEPDPGFDARIKVLGAPIAALRAKPVGSAAVPLNGARADVRTKETNLGNMIADALIERTKANGAQVAIVNGGGIRASIDAGEIILGEVLDVQPFGNTIALVTLTGAQLKEALENGVSQVETVAGRFPQVGGMRYVWNPTAPVGSRIVSIEIGNAKDGYKPFDPNGSYRVVVNNFMLNGGDGYSVLGKGTNKVDTGLIDADVLADYIRANSPVNPQVEGRIQQGTAAPAPAPGAPGVPSKLPTTGGAVGDLLWLAAAGAGTIGVGLRLRGRGQRAAEEPAEEVEEDVAV
jgi:5'-nucleotidase